MKKDKFDHLPKLTLTQMIDYILENGCLKVRTLKMESGEARFQVKEMTESEWKIFDIGGEDMTDEEKDALVEKGGWTLLDTFTASAMRRTKK